jgi:hypothetical protein
MQKMRAPISTTIAISFGMIVLLSLFIPTLGAIRERILGWAILLAAIALLIGLVNLFRIHFDHLRQNQQGAYSLILLLGMSITFLVTLLQGRQGEIANWIFNHVQFPVESTLMALLSITLTLAAARLLQQRSELSSIIFILVLFIMLLGSAPLFGFELPLFTRSITPYITRVLSIGATRGLLIGVALGTMATAIRILVGADRPFGG